MKSIHLVLLGTAVLVSGDAFDIGTTAIALLDPAFRGDFIEATNPFIRLLMYNLGLGTNGFFIGIVVSMAIDILIVYATYSQSQSYNLSGASFFSALFFLFLLGIGHWAAGYGNLTLLMQYAPFGF